MKPTLWMDVKRVFAEALDVRADRREEFVRAQCGDVQVRDEALRLLRRRDRISRFLDAPTLVRPEGGAPLSESAGPDGRARTTTGVVAVPPGGAAASSPFLAAGAVLADRYELGPRLGAGAFGAVHRAKDRLTGHDVAVKVLPLAGPSDQQAMRREVAVLRRARLPGVVELLDDGVELGHAFLVMRLVDGRAFPGAVPSAPDAPVAWDAIGPRALALVEALGRLHWLGVLHRDLKPENVLVDAQGAVTIVDLGIARDLEGLPDLSGGYLVGTPAYLAPERLVGSPATVASDLFAVGVMLWELLAGGPLRDADTFDDLVRRRDEPPRSLRDVAPAVPAHVAAAIDAMVQPDPARRPRSARVAAALLAGRSDGQRLPALPWLGSRDAIDRLVTACRTGRGCDIAGPAGSGRSRLLREAAQDLTRLGSRVLFAAPATAPFESLAPIVGQLPAQGSMTFDDVREHVRIRVRFLLMSRVALFADDAGNIDAESSQILADLRDHGPVVRVTDCDVRSESCPTPLLESDLREVFAAHDRIHHLREDGARALYDRSAGQPADVVRELEAWVSSGIARFESGLVHLDRAGLERLASRPALTLPRATGRPGLTGSACETHAVLELAGVPLELPTVASLAGKAPWMVERDLMALESGGMVRRRHDGRFAAVAALGETDLFDAERRRSLHAHVADVLDPRSEVRLFHLVAAGKLAEASLAALEAAERHLREGRVEAAAALGGDALALAADLDGQTPAYCERALAVLCDAALSAGTAAACDAALAAAARCRVDTELVRALETICRSALACIHGDPVRALSLTTRDLAHLGIEVERRRHVVRAFAARLQTDASLERQIATVGARCLRAVGHPHARSWIHEWTGWHRYRTGRYRSAMRSHERAAMHRRSPRARAAALTSAASAALEAFDLVEAGRLARQAADIAARGRFFLIEARAVWIGRTIAYRSGGEGTPDVELVSAVSGHVPPQLEALIALNESAVAWRLGLGSLAEDLARRGSDLLCVAERRPVARMAAAFLAAITGRACADGLIDAIQRPDRAPPGIRLQTLALLALSTPGETERLRRLAEPAIAALPLEFAAMRREILSGSECMEILGANVGRSAGNCAAPCELTQQRADSGGGDPRDGPSGS